MDLTEHIVVTALWDQWGNNPPTVPANGNRLFFRTIDTDPEDPSWDDWKFIGAVAADGTIDWSDLTDSESSPMAVPISKAVKGGQRFGRVLIGGFGLEWGLFLGDGPTEPRVSDWAGN